MKCNHCEYENREGALFCSQCGTPLEEPQDINVTEDIIVTEETVEDAEYVETEVLEKTAEPIETEVVEETKEPAEEIQNIDNEEIVVEVFEEYEDHHIYCEICHNEIYETTIICPHCGSATGKKIPLTCLIEDKSNIGLNLLSLICPVIGIIIYFTFKNKLPKMMNSIKNSTFIGFIAVLLIALTLSVSSLFSFKQTCQYQSSNGQRCTEEVYQDGYCQYHYYFKQTNSFFQYY